MRLFSRVVFICNICFILSVILRLVELSKRTKGDYSSALGFQPLESTLVILGYGAIFLNFLFVFVAMYRLVTRKTMGPRWLVLSNIIMFPLQFYYFFYSNI